MRQALEDKEDAKSLKQKTKERVRPKMGKLTIDYQKLHDAFFKWQTKPKMSIHGDLYYEVSGFKGGFLLLLLLLSSLCEGIDCCSLLADYGWKSNINVELSRMSFISSFYFSLSPFFTMVMSTHIRSLA